jgi:mono/diheme cytochrome c family protein
MQRLFLLSTLASWLMYGASAHAAEPASQSQVTAGKRVYDAWCVQCHGPGPGLHGHGLTGTEALEAKYNGTVPPVLDERKDLTPAQVSYFVRHGASVMASFRKTEITDEELAALGAYLSRLNPALKHR